MKKRLFSLFLVLVLIAAAIGPIRANAATISQEAAVISFLRWAKFTQADAAPVMETAPVQDLSQQIVGSINEPVPPVVEIPAVPTEPAVVEQPVVAAPTQIIEEIKESQYAVNPLTGVEDMAKDATLIKPVAIMINNIGNPVNENNNIDILSNPHSSEYGGRKIAETFIIM